jgi:hypothetical protein
MGQEGAALYWISILALGGLAGIVGQGIRTIVGLKKASDAAAIRRQKFTETIEPARLVISLLVAALAGAMAAIITLTPGAPISRIALMGLAAAGYSGADFVEGFMAYLAGATRRLILNEASHQQVGRRTLRRARSRHPSGAPSADRPRRQPNYRCLSRPCATQPARNLPTSFQIGTAPQVGINLDVYLKLTLSLLKGRQMEHFLWLTPAIAVPLVPTRRISKGKVNSDIPRFGQPGPTEVSGKDRA